MSAPLLDTADFQAWREDRVAGATALTRRAARLLLEGLLREPPAAAAEQLLPTLHDLGAAHPAFGSLWRLLDRAARVAHKSRQDGASPEELVSRTAEAARAFTADLDAAEAAVARAGAGLISEGALVATYSRSHAVERALLETRAAGRRVRVMLAESRPALEGLGLARVLAAAGIGCVFTADAMLPMLLARARVLLLGADAVTPRGLVHKAGTYPLLLAAREHNVPAYALAVRAKFLSPVPGTLALPLHPSESLLADPPAGVEVTVAPFEESPMSLIRGVVTESGVLAPNEAAEAAQTAALHASLSR